MLHRDLKPHNILLAPGERPVIADFGVARSISAARMTMTGQFVGTPAYMAPEQFEEAPATFAVDLYALGAILHEMLSGEAPFGGRDALSTIRAIREAPPPQPARRRPRRGARPRRAPPPQVALGPPARRRDRCAVELEAIHARLEAARVPDGPHEAQADPD